MSSVSTPGSVQRQIGRSLEQRGPVQVVLGLELNDLEGLFQPNPFWDSLTRGDWVH